ncbi:MAG: hypothetical protein LBQ50_08445, partial [Planctomycetaceae bacterium]|nr:hypothetical protein [Planctomycetaceae bacterium]
MIQQLISTSAPKCLNGNAGFGIVAQTHGMAPNVANTVNALSAYAHRFPAGNPQNPVVFLHTLRRTGGMLRHIVSRVADCGNDYTGRTNRLAHHWLVEENDVWTLPCGPAALAAQAIFRTEWNEVSRELPQKDLENVPIVVRKCTKWEQLTGDAGWAGIVAERAEKGDPISIIFKTGMNPVVLLAEVFALLPPEVRWQTSFSTFFIKSQEPAGGSREDKIQIKCFLEGTEEANFARQSPNTLVIDLRQKLPTGQQLFAAGACPAPGKYVETARTGQVQTASPGLAPMPQAREKSPSEYAGHSGKEAAFVMPTPSAQEQEVFDIDNLTLGVPKMSRGLTAADRAKAKRRKQQSPWLTLSACAGVVLVGAGILVWLLVSMRSPTDIAKGRTEPQQTQVTVDTKQGQEPPVSHGTEIVDEPESKPEQTPEPPTNPLPDNADKTETATPPDTPQINPE